MSKAARVEITVFGGPSLQAPFAAVAADFHSPFPSALPAESLEGLCAELLPQELRQRLALARSRVNPWAFTSPSVFSSAAS